ncbi:MAG: diaminopimelate epimerase [Bdellovibrionales bacterium]|nr:diaminopimelate epimerase [Bdellovibrionales bacterium]
MKSLKLTKMTGTGNDFLIWPEADFKPEDYFNVFKVSNRSELTQILCDRHFGIGADGLVILSLKSPSVLEWDFYNADGSSAEMCGNASRCAARYAFEKQLISQESFEILTGAGSIFAEVIQNSVRVKMTKIDNAQLGQTLKMAHQKIDFDFVNSGVPHVVICKQDYILNDILKTLCKEIQDNPLFAPDATNVTLYKPLSDGHIESVSFERGVEDFTLACGTGAVAAAFSYRKKNPQFDSVKVKVPGGQLLIEFKQDEVYMTGPAEYIADIEYNYLKEKA